jgi:anthranilate synthase component 1
MNLVVRPTFEEFRARAASANVVPVHAEILADTITPISAYLALVGDRPGYLLESAEGGEKLGRYSFIGLDPWEIVATSGQDPLAAIEERLAACRVFKDPLLPRFAGGAVGYIGCDCVRYFEPTLERVFAARPRPGLDLPEAAFMIGGKLAIFDHVKRRVILVVHARIDGAAIEDAYAAARDAIAAMAASLRAVPVIPERGGKATGEAPIASNRDRADFVAAVAAAKEYIAAGDIFQVVLSQRFERPISAPPFDIYRALRAVNPSPYMYYLHYPGQDFTIVGSSPEVMVRVEDRKITLRPIAGTRPRGVDEAEDRRLEAELLADEKERAEHIMLVDLGRNDVGRVAMPGTLRVDELMTIERYSHVMHIVSNVTGRLDDARSACDVIRAAFPAGTVSGAPKIRAMEIIAELEPTLRGPYAGAVGYIGWDGNADTAIVLRTVLVKDGIAYVQAGAGIVHDSVPEREFEETENKARAMMRALAWAEAGL